VNSITVAAFINTDIAASFAAIVWLVIEWNTGERKPTFIGLMTGAVAGLATITPAAGYVTVGSAVMIGILAGIGTYFAVQFKNRMGWDDALDVWGVHGIGGVLGTLLLGVFASSAINPGTADGIIYGGSFALLGKELVAILLATIWASGFTWGTLHLIDRFTKVRVGEAAQEKGLDIIMHGEIARAI
jgi:Amt family ammonium transporter